MQYIHTHTYNLYNIIYVRACPKLGIIPVRMHTNAHKNAFAGSESLHINIHMLTYTHAYIHRQPTRTVAPKSSPHPYTYL